MKLPVDAKTQRVVKLYESADKRIQALIAAALDRGAQGTAAFYTRQLAEVRRALIEVQQAAVPEAAVLVGAGYVEGVKYVDDALGLDAAKFAGIHRQAVDVLADNMVHKLHGAATTVGRQAEDLFRKAGLRAAAEQITTGQTRKAVSEAMRRNLIRDGATCFTDRAGRRWTLGAYSKMVARTTTREAVTHGTANRLLESGHDLVTISKHSHDHDVCSDYEGRTFSLTGETPGYDTLDTYPPFHPNCVHVLTPAAATFEQFEKSVGSDAVQEEAQQVQASPPGGAEASAVPDDGQIAAARERAVRSQAALDELSPRFGDRLTIEAPLDDADVLRHLEGLRLLPEHVVEELVRHDVKVVIGNKAVPHLDKMSHLRGQSAGGGYGEHMTWEDVGACYEHFDRQMILGRSPWARSDDHEFFDTAVHEAGHALDHVRGLKDPSKGRYADLLPSRYDRDFDRLHRENYDRLPTYLQQGGPGGIEGKSETWAEGISATLSNERRARELYGDELIDFFLRALAK